MKERAKILIATSLMLPFVGPICVPEKVAATPVTAQEETKKAETIFETEEWKEIREKWSEIEEVKVENFEEAGEKLSESKKGMDSLLNILVEEGYITGVTAAGISAIYCENLQITMDSMLPIPMCYSRPAPPEWDVTGIDTKEELEKKLALVEELYDKGTVEKTILDVAKKDIEKRLSLLDRADKYWTDLNEGTCKDHPGEVDVMIHLYELNTGNIKENKDREIDLIKASEYIVILENNEI